MDGLRGKATSGAALATVAFVSIALVVVNRPDEPGTPATLRYAYFALWSAAALFVAADLVPGYRMVMPLLFTIGALSGMTLAIWIVADPWKAWAGWLLVPVVAAAVARVHDSRPGRSGPPRERSPQRTVVE